MAQEYFLYTTLFNNTLVARSDNSFAPLPPNTGEIFIDFFIPTNQPLYYYRESGATIILNDEDTIDAYLNATTPADPDEPVTTETFTGYTAQTEVVISGITGLTLQQDPNFDVYNFPPNADGYVHEAGRSIFNTGINDTGQVLSRESPKALQFETLTDNNVGRWVLADVENLNQGSIFGLNAVSAATSAETKVITYGAITNLDTSDFTELSPLYIDPENAGELVTLKPFKDAFQIGIVIKSDPVDGIVFINSIRLDDPASAAIPSVFERFIFTADEETTTGGTFFLVSETGSTAASDTINALNIPPDTPTPCDQDLLTEIVDRAFNVAGGQFTAQLNIDTSGSGSGDDRLSIEVYKSNLDGDAIDSGLLIGVGSLGVRPMVVLTTGIIDLSTSAGFETPRLEGVLVEDVTIENDERIRLRIIAEKVGGSASLKNYIIDVGQSNLTFIDIPKSFRLEDLNDVNIVDPQVDDLLQLQSNSLWANVPLSGVTVPLDVFTGYTAATEARFVENKLQLVLTIGGINMNTSTPIFIPWDSQEFLDTSIFSHTNGSEAITILKDGLYEISYNINGDAESGRGILGAAFRLNGSDFITQTLTASYTRNTANDNTNNSLPSYLIQLNTNDTLEVGTFQLGDNVSIFTVADGLFVRINYLG